MSNNSMKVLSRKFIADMAAPDFNQKDFILYEKKQLNKNIKKLSYNITPEKQQLLKEIQALNTSVEICLESEYKDFESMPRVKRRYEFTVVVGVLIIISFLLAVNLIFGVGMF